VGLGIVMFDLHSLATVYTYNFEGERIPIRFGIDVIWHGIGAAFKIVDAATDLEMGYFVLMRAAQGQCMWIDSQQNCSKVRGMGIGLLLLATLDLVMSMLQSFLSKRFSDGDLRYFWPGVAVYTMSLACDTLIACVIILEGRATRLVGATDNQLQSSGLTPRQHSAYIAASLVLTFASFLTSLIGIRKLFDVLRKTTVALGNQLPVRRDPVNQEAVPNVSGGGVEGTSNSDRQVIQTVHTITRRP
jgi:hypothetical protein